MEKTESALENLIFKSSKLGELLEGRTFRIHANLPQNGNIFAIDFITDLSEKDTPPNIALRLMGKIDESYITRSYRKDKVWSDEEKFSETPYVLEIGKHIMIEVLILENKFLIAVNGFHCAEFTHQFPYKNIKNLEIRGDLEDVLVDRKITTQYPQRPLNSLHFGRISSSNVVKENSDAKEVNPNQNNDNINNNNNNNNDNNNVFDENDEVYNEEDFLNPNQSNQNQKNDRNYDVKEHYPLPYFARVDNGLLRTCSALIIIGRVRAFAKDFTVTLQKGRQHWPPPLICYQVKFILFDEDEDEKQPCKGLNNEIVNAQHDDKIKLQLIFDHSGFSTFINKMEYDMRPYRVNPKHIDTIVVRGDIKLINIQIEV